MTNSHIEISESEFLGLCARVLRVPVESLSLATAREDLAAWDSIAHLRLVMEAEAACGVEIPLARIPDIRTLGELQRLLGVDTAIAISKKLCGSAAPRELK